MMIFMNAMTNKSIRPFHLAFTVYNIEKTKTFEIFVVGFTIAAAVPFDTVIKTGFSESAFIS